MDYFKFYYCLGIFICLLLATKGQESDYAPYIGERYDTFDWNLVKTLDLITCGNVIISPISVKLVLAMLYEASTQTTEKELQEVLNFPVSRHATRDRFLQIINSANLNSTDQTLLIGNRIFLHSSLRPSKRYANILQKYYNSDIVSVDFSKTLDTRTLINNWASNVTQGHVKKLINDDGLNAAVMVLANALYFKGLWNIPFDRSQTKADFFYSAPEKSSSVHFMINFGTYYYSQIDELEAQFLRISYRGNISMFIILPNKVDGLKDIVRKLNSKTLNNLRWSLSPEDIYVHLPKFSFKSKTELVDPLKILGLKEIFDDIASLPGITTGRKNLTDVKVSKFIQKSGIEINEEGTTAWAATQVTVANKFGSRKTFKANHPFLFYLEEETTGNVLFVGKVENPQKIEANSDRVIKDAINKLKNNATLTTFK